VITPAKFGEKNGDKGNTMIMASTRDTIVWTPQLLHNEDENWTVSAKVTCDSHGHYGEFSLLAFDEKSWQISETLNRPRNRFISLSFMGERWNPDCSARIPIRQFRHL